MYAYFKGTIVDKKNDYIVLETNNIGYKIFMGESSINSLDTTNEVKIYTYLNVKEDEMSLYGFITSEELRTFEQLIQISGVGPKVGKTIVSTLGAEATCIAIATGDTTVLTKVSGVGNKMAQRIILELKDKISKEQLISKSGEKASVPSKSSTENKNVEEASFALKVLGYSSRQIEETIKGIEILDESVEGIIKAALRYLSK